MMVGQRIPKPGSDPDGPGGTEGAPPGDVPPPPAGRPAEDRVDEAFDEWLRRGLSDLYGDVAAEPVPEELLRIIDEDRSRQGG